jgi:hypothetical protein
MSWFTRFRSWLQGPPAEDQARKQAERMKDKRDNLKASQSDSPGPWPAGIVTPDRVSKDHE